MENINIQPSQKTPTINFDSSSGVLEISGRSIPENSVEFYRPVLEWLDNYNNSPATSTEFIFKLEYFNTSSSKCILDIFRKLELVAKSGSDIKIKWYFDEDDEDMQESGEDFQEIINLPFEMIEMKDND